MKKSEIKVGSFYTAKVSGRLTIVRVDAIRDAYSFNRPYTRYDVTNMTTKRRTTFKSAAKFRSSLNSNSQEQKPSTVSATAAIATKLRSAKSTPPVENLVVEALAGTGKTFTMIVGVVASLAPKLWPEFLERMREIKNDPDLEIEPSDEQAAVWEHLRQYGDVSNVTYCAFNKSIVNEFSESWGWLAQMLAENGLNLKFATVNSLGNSALFRAYGRLNVTDNHTGNLLARYMGMDPKDLRYKEPLLLSAVDKIVGLCKLTLAGYEDGAFSPSNVTADVMDDLIAHFDIDLNGQRDRVYRLVPEILRMSLEASVHKEVDFNDQNWLPIVLDLPIPKCDLIMVDEGQDLPRCKQEFVRRAGRNVIVVGDAYQAIYGFAGADTESIPRMRQLLSAQTLRLTETRRCGKTIVEEANHVLSRLGSVVFRAHDSNSQGTVDFTVKAKYHRQVQDGDMVLSRVNAPLVSQALRFIKDGRKAVIRGREFGTELINFIKRMGAEDVPDLIEKTGQWFTLESEKEQRKKNPSEARLIAMEDRLSCITALCDGAATIDAVVTNVETIFAGKICPACGRSYNETTDRCCSDSCKTEKDPVSGYACGPKLVTPKGILFSSVHRAKGLEAANVFILTCDGSMFPHPMAKTDWQCTQEYNLLYVAITRAINRLTYVTDK